MDDMANIFRNPRVADLGKFTLCEESKSVSVKDISNGANTAEAVTTALDEAVNIIIEEGLLPDILNRKGERYRIVGTRYTGLVTIDRIASSAFGIAACGVVLIAYEYDENGRMILWVQHRGADVFYSSMYRLIKRLPSVSLRRLWFLF